MFKERWPVRLQAVVVVVALLLCLALTFDQKKLNTAEGTETVQKHSSNTSTDGSTTPHDNNTVELQPTIVPDQTESEKHTVGSSPQKRIHDPNGNGSIDPHDNNVVEPTIVPDQTESEKHTVGSSTMNDNNQDSDTDHQEKNNHCENNLCLFYQDATVAAFTELAKRVYQSKGVFGSVPKADDVILEGADIFMSEIGFRHMLNSSNYLPPILQPPPAVQLDCTNPIYSQVLTGNVASPENHKRIVDIVPFGFDIDILEIRLLEYYEFVDLFVIGEQDRAHRGNYKGFWFPKLLNTSRFSRFKDKIVYVPYTVPDDLIPKEKHDRNMDWRVENLMRDVPFDYLKENFFHNMTEEEQSRYYIFQNDADEVASRSAVAHFRQCEHRDSLHAPVSMAGQTYKRNTVWMEQTYDMTRLRLVQDQEKYRELTNFIWRPGPTLFKWKDHNSVPRTAKVSDPHMGLGSGNHFSSPGHPIVQLIKTLSTVDTFPMNGRFSPEFWQRAKDGMLSYGEDFSRKDMISNYCELVKRRKFPYRFVGSVFKPETQEFLVQSLPWAMTQIQPYRYPHLYRPGIVKEEKEIFEADCGFALN